MRFQDRVINSPCLLDTFVSDALEISPCSLCESDFFVLSIFAGVFVADHTVYLVQPRLFSFEQSLFPVPPLGESNIRSIGQFENRRSKFFLPKRPELLQSF